MQAAEKVLVRDGPGAVTVRAVAAEAEVAPMGIYNRFGGKDGLIEQLLVRGFTRLSEAVAATGVEDPIGRLRESGLGYRRFALENPQFYAVMFTDAIPHDLQSERVAAAGGAAFEQLVGHVAFALDAGALTPGDAGAIAQQLWSGIHGAVMLEMTGLIQTSDADVSYRALIETLLRGLTP